MFILQSDLMPSTIKDIPLTTTQTANTYPAPISLDKMVMRWYRLLFGDRGSEIVYTLVRGDVSQGQHKSGRASSFLLSDLSSV